MKASQQQLLTLGKQYGVVDANDDKIWFPETFTRAIYRSMLELEFEEMVDIDVSEICLFAVVIHLKQIDEKTAIKLASLVAKVLRASLRIFDVYDEDK